MYSRRQTRMEDGRWRMAPARLRHLPSSIHHPRFSTTTRAAFTLIEILIVVVILGILATIVVPQFSNASINAKENTFIYQPPRSLWGYGAGEVTREGAVWLEVTYAKGLSVGGGPIEEPIAAEQ